MKCGKKNRTPEQRAHASLMFKWEDEVVDDVRFAKRPHAQRIVTLLRRRMRGDPCECCVEQGWLADKLRISARAVQYAIDDLIGFGHLEIASGAAAGKANVYRPKLAEGVRTMVRTPLRTVMLRGSAPGCQGGQHHGAGGVRTVVRTSTPYPQPYLSSGNPLPDEAAFVLLDELAKIAGLRGPAIEWEEGWRHGQKVVAQWLSKGWPPALISATVSRVMLKKTDGPPHSVKYFEPAIQRAIKEAPDAAPRQTIGYAAHARTRVAQGGLP